MNAVQACMAKSALQWSTRQLASFAEVPVVDAQAFLIGGKIHEAYVSRMRAAFENNGLLFIDEWGGSGVVAKHVKSGDHPKPVGPATDAVEKMEAEIAANRRKR